MKLTTYLQLKPRNTVLGDTLPSTYTSLWRGA